MSQLVVARHRLVAGEQQQAAAGERFERADAAEGADRQQEGRFRVLAPVSLQERQEPWVLIACVGDRRQVVADLDALQEVRIAQVSLLARGEDSRESLVQDAVPHLERILRGRIEGVVGQDDHRVARGARAERDASAPQAQLVVPFQVEEGEVEGAAGRGTAPGARVPPTRRRCSARSRSSRTAGRVRPGRAPAPAARPAAAGTGTRTVPSPPPARPGRQAPRGRRASPRPGRAGSPPPCAHRRAR